MSWPSTTHCLGEVAAYLKAGNKWPRHNKTDDREERTLGVWLHTQCIDYRAGRLTAGKEEQLSMVIPAGGRGGRGWGANSRRSCAG